MASHIKKGESIFIPFRDGLSISDSQLKPRMYKTIQAFEKSFPGYYLGTEDVELAEYAEVVRCKDCKHFSGHGACHCHAADENGTPIFVREEDFCSYGERRTDGSEG
jgi:hypothetical protein